MCLYLRDKQPRIAKEDIIVLKHVKLLNNDIISPYQHTTIPINKVMKASPDKEDINCCNMDLLGNTTYSLSGGAIHAKLIEERFFGLETKKAIIPAGTEYWVGIQGDEIAARSMIITDTNWYDGNNKVSKSIFEEILKNAPEVNGVKIGDYLLENGDYIRPQKGLSEDNIVGIVAGFHDGEPLIVALKYYNGVYDRLYNSKFGEHYKNYKDIIKVFNGRNITKEYKENNRDFRFEAFETCINYRKDRNEEWYFPSIGEVVTMLDNCAYLNAAYQITGLGFVIYDEWYSSCSEKSYWCSWCCYFEDCKVYCDWNYKHTSNRIVPFFNLQK